MYMYIICIQSLHVNMYTHALCMDLCLVKKIAGHNCGKAKTGAENCSN